MLKHRIAPLSVAATLIAISSATTNCSRSEPPAPQDPAAASEAAGPRARLRLSGRLEGRLEPCGCASGQVGGLSRRSFRLQQDRGSYDFLIEGGDLTIDGGPLDELKLLTILNVLDDARARYDVVGIGPGDLRLPRELLAGYLEGFPQLPFVCADLVASDETTWPAKPFVDLAQGDAKIRVTGFVGAKPAADEDGESAFELLPAQAAWDRAMDGVADDALRVLLHHGAEPRAAAELDPRPDLVVVIGAMHAEPPREPELVDGVPFVHPGIRGRFMLDVTLARIDGTPRITRYHAFPLEGSRTAEGALADDDVEALILAHRFEVAEDGTREAMAERRPTASGAEYVGTPRCASCHAAAHEKWQESKHAAAWETLATAQESGRYAWPVDRYPDCVACHSVGYGEVSGFVNPERSPGLEAVGCESCHGPGSRHVANPIEHKMGRIGAESCLRCHDFEQSPNFDYAERWRVIEHR